MYLYLHTRTLVYIFGSLRSSLCAQFSGYLFAFWWHYESLKLLAGLDDLCYFRPCQYIHSAVVIREGIIFIWEKISWALHWQVHGNQGIELYQIEVVQSKKSYYHKDFGWTCVLGYICACYFWLKTLSEILYTNFSVNQGINQGLYHRESCINPGLCHRVLKRLIINQGLCHIN